MTQWSGTLSHIRQLFGLAKRCRIGRPQPDLFISCCPLTTKHLDQKVTGSPDPLRWINGEPLKAWTPTSWPETKLHADNSGLDYKLTPKKRSSIRTVPNLNSPPRSLEALRARRCDPIVQRLVDAAKRDASSILEERESAPISRCLLHRSKGQGQRQVFVAEAGRSTQLIQSGSFQSAASTSEHGPDRRRAVSGSTTSIAFEVLGVECTDAAA